MRFSQRIGKTPVSKEIQLEHIDDELKNQLWNLVKIFYLDKLEKRADVGQPEFQTFATL